MKKFALLALAALIALPLSAQDDDELDNVIFSSTNDVVRFEALSHIGYGYHFVNSPDFQSRMSDEYFLNIVSLGIYPADALAIELGLDVALSDFGSRTHAFLQGQNRLIQCEEFSRIEQGTLDRHYGSFTVASVNAPLLLKLRAGSFWIGGGAVGSLNVWGRTYYAYRQRYREVAVTERRAKVNTFTFGLVATLGFDSFGLYFKYYPRTSRLLPDGSVDMNYMTLGVVLDF
jgi:hypothetical protein